MVPEQAGPGACFNKHYGLPDWATHRPPMQGFIQDFSTGGGGSISATVQPPTLHEVGGGNYASTDLIGPVGSGGLPIMNCAPNILSKIGIDVQNIRYCHLSSVRL